MIIVIMEVNGPADRAVIEVQFIERHQVPTPVLARYKLNSTTRTRTDFVGDPHGPNGVSPQKKSVRVRSGPVGFVSGPCRVRVVEFSYTGAA